MKAQGPQGGPSPRPWALGSRPSGPTVGIAPSLGKHCGQGLWGAAPKATAGQQGEARLLTDLSDQPLSYLEAAGLWLS